MKSQAKPILSILNSLIREGFEKFGRYYSSYRGFVADVNDPDGYGRLKLVIPQITSKFALEYWAWPSNNFSGNGYGSQVLPQKGDMVWVEFEMGNPRKPIWKFGHFGELADGTSEKPEDLKDPKNYWFKTPGGHLICLDDTNKWVLLQPVEKFLIGSKEAEQPIVLGNKLKEKINTLCDIVKDLATQCAAITVTNAAGPTTPPNNATAIGQIGAQATQLKTEISEILSKVAFIEK